MQLSFARFGLKKIALEKYIYLGIMLFNKSDELTNNGLELEPRKWRTKLSTY